MWKIASLYVSSAVGRSHRRLLAALFCLGAAAGAASAAEVTTATDDENFAEKSDILQKAETKAETAKKLDDNKRLVERKLLQAELMYKVKNLQECIDLCDQALAFEPGNRKAIALKRAAGDLRLKDQTGKLDTERAVRDQALLELATEEGLSEPFGPDVPRPTVEERDFPFGTAQADKLAMTDVLQARIPEINLVEADLNFVLLLLFKTTGVNIIYKPDDVSGKTVTIFARDLTLEDVLKYLSRTLEIGYNVDKGTVWIYSKGDDDEVKRGLMRPVIIPISHGMYDSGQGQKLTNASTSSGNGANNNNNNNNNEDETSTTHIEEILTWMASNWPGWPAETTWMIDTKTSCLIITSTPDIINDVREIIRMVDVPCPQALVVARFVTVSESDLDQLGFNWSLIKNPNATTDTVDNSTGAAANSNYWQESRTRLSDTSSSLGVAADAFTTGFTSIMNDRQLSLALQALTSKTNSKVLVSPRVIAQNDRWATIDLSDKIIWYQDVDAIQNDVTTDTNAQSSTTIVPTNPKEEQIGYTLQVKPRIGADMKSINLTITPTIKSKVRDDTKTVVVTTVDGEESVDIKIPVINTQTLTVDAGVEDQQTLVVGGLFLDNYSEASKGVPILKDMPVLGKFFRNKDNSRDRSCLLIFVTVRLLTPANSTYSDNRALATKELGKDRALKGDVSVDVINRWLGDPSRQ